MAKSKEKEKEAQTFEEDLERLEEIVHALEEGGLPLDEALKQFEEGMTLKRKCEKALTAAEKRIELLIENSDGDLEATPFDEDAAEAAAKPAPKASKKASPAPKDDTPPEPPIEDEDDGELLF